MSVKPGENDSSVTVRRKTARVRLPRFVIVSVGLVGPTEIKCYCKERKINS